MYTDRVTLLQKIFKEQSGPTNVQIVDARCNVLFIVTNLLKSAPFSIENIKCSKTDCANSHVKLISSPTVILRIEQGFTTLENDLIKYLHKSYECNEENCHGTIISTRTLQNHLFIETDVFADENLFALDDFPAELCIHTKR